MNNCNGPSRTLRLGVTFLLLVMAATLGACVKQVHHPALDVTFLPQKGEFISKYGEQLSLEEIIRISADKDYILIGEGHKNVCDHKVQQTLLKALAATERPLSVGLEMVAVDMQPVLDDFGDGLVEVDALEEELQWSAKWGYSFSLFRPLFNTINRNSLPVAGLNVPSSVIKTISKEGLEGLSEDPACLFARRDRAARTGAARFSGHGLRPARGQGRRQRHRVRAVPAGPIHLGLEDGRGSGSVAQAI